MAAGGSHLPSPCRRRLLPRQGPQAARRLRPALGRPRSSGEPQALYGAWSPVPPFAPFPSSIATSRARSLGESASSAAARASTVPAFAVSAVLVQPLVQPADGLDVTPCSDKRFGCVGS